MRKMDIREIQDISLEMLRHIDEFCRNHGIRYFLDSGTLLGAARSGKFILWDDDADIVMPRPDYDRFVREYEDTEKFRLFAPSRGNCYLHYARLCEMEKTYFKQKLRWTFEDPGVGVDILPMDGAPDSLEEYDKFQALIVKVRNKIWKLRQVISKKTWALRSDWFGFTKDCAHWAIWVFLRINFSWMMRLNLWRIRRLRLKYPYETSAHCFYIAVITGRKKYWHHDWFADVDYLDLCGEKFPAPAGYDERLTAEYGDWRTPPPESSRLSHECNQTMWWRD